MNRSKVNIHETIITKHEKNNVTLEMAMGWTDVFHETTLCFTNNIPQKDGGTHLAGFRAALTRVINNYSLIITVVLHFYCTYSIKYSNNIIIYHKIINVTNSTVSEIRSH